MGRGGGGSEDLKCFVTGGQNFFFFLFVCVCVCVCGGGSGSVPLLPRKNNQPLLLINDGPYNKSPKSHYVAYLLLKILLVIP